MISFYATCVFVVVFIAGLGFVAWRNRKRPAPEPEIEDPYPIIKRAAQLSGERFHRVRGRRNTDLDESFPDLAEEARRKAHVR